MNHWRNITTQPTPKRKDKDKEEEEEEEEEEERRDDALVAERAGKSQGEQRRK